MTDQQLALIDTLPVEPAPDAPMGVRKWAVLVVAVHLDNEQGVTAAEIEAELARRGDPMPNNGVGSRLNQLVADRMVVRTDRFRKVDGVRQPHRIWSVTDAGRDLVRGAR